MRHQRLLHLLCNNPKCNEPHTAKRLTASEAPAPHDRGLQPPRWPSAKRLAASEAPAPLAWFDFSCASCAAKRLTASEAPARTSGARRSRTASTAKRLTASEAPALNLLLHKDANHSLLNALRHQRLLHEDRRGNSRHRPHLLNALRHQRLLHALNANIPDMASVC